jgi:uncharacterized protein YukE
MAAVPADYSAITLTVVPTELATAATIVDAAVTEVVTCLNSIDDTLNGLELGWNGSTAAEAKDFGDQWAAAMAQMFGTKGHASDGVLNMVIFALKSSANNYNAAEDAIVGMFSKFGATFVPSGADGTGPIAAGDTIANGSLSAVGESNWSALGA